MKDVSFYNLLQILTTAYMATQSITLCVPHAEVFASARAAASAIFQLMDREPKIDSLDQAGLTPRRVKGEISLEDVHFVYPSRPDIKVYTSLQPQITVTCTSVGQKDTYLISILNLSIDPSASDGTSVNDV